MIESYSFGRMKIQGRVFTDDVLICKEEVISPWWRERGHVVTVRDLEAILGYKPEIIILGQGEPGMMKGTQELQAHLQALGIEFIQVRTKKAVELFNRYLEQGKTVCAGFHLTC
ncbi:MAG: Mth938-like domain-containing protein, partial [Desulfovermiculus sp.]